MICILTEDKAWVPDAVTLLESQGHEVEVTFAEHSDDLRTWHDRLAPWIGACTNMTLSIEVTFGGNSPAHGTGLISVRTDTETSDGLNSIYDQILEIALE